MSKVITGGNAATNYVTPISFVAERLAQLLNGKDIIIPISLISKTGTFLEEAHHGFYYTHGFVPISKKPIANGIALPSRQLVLDCLEKINGKPIEGGEGESYVRELSNSTDSLEKRQIHRISQISEEMRVRYKSLLDMLNQIMGVANEEFERNFQGIKGKYDYF